MKRSTVAATLVLFSMALSPVVLRADDGLKKVQQSLRDQGFYYGTINGAPGDETTQAIRRYQIRNGLTVSGQLNDETRSSILKNSAGTGGGSGSSGNSAGGGVKVAPGGTVRPRGTPSVAATPRPAPVAESTPGPLSTPRSLSTPSPLPTAPPVRREPVPGVRAEADDEGGFHRGAGLANPPTYRPAPRRGEDDDEGREAPRPAGPGRDLRALPPGGVASSPALSNLFADTSYELAPPPVQRETLLRAQRRLLRQGFYDQEPDGRPSALTTEALSNFQGFNHLRRTGRLDTATLATMRLLPERQQGRPYAGSNDGEDRPRRGQGQGGVYEGRVVQ